MDVPTSRPCTFCSQYFVGWSTLTWDLYVAGSFSSHVTSSQRLSWSPDLTYLQVASSPFLFQFFCNIFFRALSLICKSSVSYAYLSFSIIMWVHSHYLALSHVDAHTYLLNDTRSYHAFPMWCAQGLESHSTLHPLSNPKRWVQLYLSQVRKLRHTEVKQIDQSTQLVGFTFTTLAQNPHPKPLAILNE